MGRSSFAPRRLHLMLYTGVRSSSGAYAWLLCRRRMIPVGCHSGMIPCLQPLTRIQNSGGRIAKLPRVAAPQGWYAALDNKPGAPFFHNTLTKERCWTDPRTRNVRTAACVHNLD